MAKFEVHDAQFTKTIEADTVDVLAQPGLTTAIFKKMPMSQVVAVIPLTDGRFVIEKSAELK